MVIAAVGGIALIIALIYLFRDQIGEALTPDEEAKLKEAEKAAARDEKGAIGNTIDFFFGEGTHKRNQEKAKRENEAGQHKVERPNNVAPPNPAEPTPWESFTEWWDNGLNSLFARGEEADQPAPPAATQGPPSESVIQVVHTQPPTEGSPKGMAVRGGAGSGRAGRGR